MQHQLQLEIGAGQLVMAQQTGGRLVQMYQSRAQYAELVKLPPFELTPLRSISETHLCRFWQVPVLLLLAELHQMADSPVTALPAVLCCLSLCDGARTDGRNPRERLWWVLFCRLTGKSPVSQASAWSCRTPSRSSI